MLLHDLVKIESRPKSVKTVFPEIEDVATIESQLQSLIAGSALFEKPAQNTLINQANKAYAETFNDLRQDAFQRMLYLPEVLRKSVRYDSYYGTVKPCDDVLSVLSDTPQASLSQIRAVADALQMIIIPLEWLNRAAYNGEPRSTEGSVISFRKAANSAGLNTFVVTPLAYYSVMAHAQAQDPNLPIYGGKLQMIITSVTLAIPLFRTLLKEVEAVRGSLKEVDNRLSTQLEGMQAQITMLQAQIKQAQEEAARAAEEARKATAAAKKAQAEADAMKDMIFYANDPMVFAMVGNDLMSNQRVLVGPCWGPEFSPDLAGAYKLPVFPGQRRIFLESSQALSRTY